MDTATGKPVATKEESGTVDLSESETRSFHVEEVTGRPVAYKTGAGEPCASSKSDQPGRPEAERKERSHNLYVSPATIQHTEGVFSIVKGIDGREHNDPVDDMVVNTVMWGISECHSTSCSSSWKRLFGEFTIREKSSLD